MRCCVRGNGGDFRVSRSRLSLNLTLTSGVVPTAQPVAFESFTCSGTNSGHRSFQKLPSPTVLSFPRAVLSFTPINRACVCKTRAWGPVWLLCSGWGCTQRNRVPPFPGWESCWRVGLPNSLSEGQCFGTLFSGGCPSFYFSHWLRYTAHLPSTKPTTPDSKLKKCI